MVQHLYDKRKDPRRPNLRQVHLIEEELIRELNTVGFFVSAGDLGENVTTRHLDLLALAAGTVLRLGQEARIRITGLRAPCIKLDRLHQGLRHAVTLTGNRSAAMKRAVMAEVIRGGLVRTGDAIEMEASFNGSLGLLRPV